MLFKTGNKIKVDTPTGIKSHDIYEKRVMTKLTVNKPLLIQRKQELEDELHQINLDLSQITEDENNQE